MPPATSNGQIVSLHQIAFQSGISYDFGGSALDTSNRVHDEDVVFQNSRILSLWKIDNNQIVPAVYYRHNKYHDKDCVTFDRAFNQQSHTYFPYIVKFSNSEYRSHQSQIDAQLAEYYTQLSIKCGASDYENINSIFDCDKSIAILKVLHI